MCGFHMKQRGTEKKRKTPKIFLVEDLKTPCLYGTSIYLPIDVPTDEKSCAIFWRMKRLITGTRIISGPLSGCYAAR